MGCGGSKSLIHFSYTSMHSISFRDYTIRVFVDGDYEFLGKMYGISGASGKVYTPW